MSGDQRSRRTPGVPVDEANQAVSQAEAIRKFTNLPGEGTEDGAPQGWTMTRSD